MGKRRSASAGGCWPAERALSVASFLRRRRDWLVTDRPPVTIDVRSPEEFEKGHIPGAASLPLSLDEDGKEAPDLAVGQGHPSLPSLLRLVEDRCDRGAPGESPVRHVLVYCKRGLMGSQSVAAFLTEHGFEAYILEGGYKAFTAWAEGVLRRPQKICAVAGATGSGKTEVLSELRLLGLQVIDLEALACHKGSVFGHLGEEPQPTSEHFRNLVAMEWAELDPDRFIFLEDEGAHIWEVNLPSVLYGHLRKAQLVVQLDVPFELRVQRSLATYGPFGADALGMAVSLFRGKMGDEGTDHLLGLLARGELRATCEAVLRNYDRTYEYHLLKSRDTCAIVTVPIHSLDAAASALCVAEAAAQREPDVSASEEQPAAFGRGASGALCREAACFCGAVVLRVRGDPQAVSICHCSICRRLSGAPCAANALFAPACVELLAQDGSEAQLVETRTSPAVVRQRCAACFAPVVGLLGKKFAAVPLGLFRWDGGPLPPAWRPQHHLHYEDRILDMDDGLPKFAGRAGGRLWTAPEEDALRRSSDALNF
mmetsp:Transcript_111594/g.296592  ORF Transcript_111594/g.296592 Transcript_111594/m.296592 type:complete len:540 (-) Transcript_111594:14-1633(-)